MKLLTVLKLKYVLLSAVVSAGDSLPTEIGETIVEATRGIPLSVQEFNELGNRTRRGRPQIPIPEETLEYLLQLYFLQIG